MERQLRNYKAVLIPLGAVIILAVISIAVINFLFGRISNMRSQITATEQKNEILEARLSTLQDSEGQVVDNVNSASIAIPPQNPSVFVTNSLKTLSVEKNVALSRLTIIAIGNPAPQGDVAEATDSILTYEVNFEASAENYTVLSDFINSLSATRPLLTLSSIIVESQAIDEGVEAQVKLISYSSPFPEVLPALDQPLAGLSDAEQQTMTLLDSFTAPDLASSEVTPTDVSPRDDPFSLGL